MKLKYLIIHCTYTHPSLRLTKRHILDWHLAKWDRAGYSDLILRDGTLHNITPFNQDNEVDSSEITWGVKGINGIARHLCLEGGQDQDGQSASPLRVFPDMEKPLKKYIEYTILRHPGIKIAGHYQFDIKKPFCPGFNVPEFCEGFIDENNIHR